MTLQIEVAEVAPERALAAVTRGIGGRADANKRVSVYPSYDIINPGKKVGGMAVGC